MKALICNALCFNKTENDRFGPISGGVFGTQANVLKMIKENFKKVKNTKKSFLDSIEKSYFYLS